MVKYACDNCDKIFYHKNDYNKHINKKISCNKDEEKPFICNYCDKRFTRTDNLYRHEKNNCLFRIENERKMQIEMLVKKITDLESKVNIGNNTTINNINSNNILQNINIIINPHGKEDISHITFNDYKNIFQKCNSCVPAFIELKHFNKNKPENSNVYISNMKSEHAYVYDGKQWNAKNKNEVMKDLYDNNCEYLIEKFEDLKDKLDESILKKFMKFIGKYEQNEFENNSINGIRYILYNNRSKPIEFRKQKLNNTAIGN
jgi:hypothetical protein